MKEQPDINSLPLSAEVAVSVMVGIEGDWDEILVFPSVLAQAVAKDILSGPYENYDYDDGFETYSVAAEQKERYTAWRADHIVKNVLAEEMTDAE